MTSAVEKEIRARGYTDSDHNCAWVGFWFATWTGIALSGGLAGLIVSGLTWLVSDAPAMDTARFVQAMKMPLAGLILASAVGFIVVGLMSAYSWLFRSFHAPLGLAAIAGGLSALVCTLVFLPAIVITMPIGVAGGWIAAKAFLNIELGKPLLLFRQLREEQWRDQ